MCFWNRTLNEPSLLEFFEPFLWCCSKKTKKQAFICFLVSRMVRSRCCFRNIEVLLLAEEPLCCFFRFSKNPKNRSVVFFASETQKNPKNRSVVSFASETQKNPKNRSVVTCRSVITCRSVVLSPRANPPFCCSKLQSGSPQEEKPLVLFETCRSVVRFSKNPKNRSVVWRMVRRIQEEMVRSRTSRKQKNKFC